MKIKKLALLGIVLVLVVTGATSFNNKGEYTKRFKNIEMEHQISVSSIWNIITAQFTVERIAPVPTKALPLVKLSSDILNRDKSDAIYRLGHSTLLIRLSEKYILIDPIFSERASPVQWAGPKRFHQSPISIDQLPHISAVIISHDHYDHLDEASIKALDKKVDRFITPLNVGSYIKDWGVAAHKVQELSWWQNTEIDHFNVIATPSQHFSGRGLFDKDSTLWASWVIESPDTKLFYSGDTGYFSGFKEIGEKYGPFDFTMIETGAYNELWHDIHMTPEQSLQAHIDVKGRHMIPVHNGTFDLAFHDWYEPFERIFALSNLQAVSLLTPQFGEKISITSPEPTAPWWRDAMGHNSGSNKKENKQYLSQN